MRILNQAMIHFWGVINERTHDYFVKNGVDQNLNCDFSVSERAYPDKQRCLTKALFERKLANGDVIKRDYLVYSCSQGSVFCAPCKLFRGKSQFGESGFNDWKHANQRVIEHENSQSHRDCVLMFKRRSNEQCRIDKHLLSQLEEEVKYWRCVLQRVVAVVKKLSSRGLAIHGENEVFASVKNGNFMIPALLIGLLVVVRQVYDHDTETKYSLPR